MRVGRIPALRIRERRSARVRCVRRLTTRGYRGQLLHRRASATGGLCRNRRRPAAPPLRVKEDSSDSVGHRDRLPQPHEISRYRGRARCAAISADTAARLEFPLLDWEAQRRRVEERYSAPVRLRCASRLCEHRGLLSRPFGPDTHVASAWRIVVDRAGLLAPPDQWTALPGTTVLGRGGPRARQEGSSSGRADS